MISLLAYWWWLLWDLNDFKLFFATFSTFEFGAELSLLVFWYLEKKGIF